MKTLLDRTRCLVRSPWISYAMLSFVAVPAGTVVGVAEARVERQRNELAALQSLGEQHAVLERLEEPAAAARTAPAPRETALPRRRDELARAGVAAEGSRRDKLERVVPRSGKTLNVLPVRWPVRGPINSEFGLRASPWDGEPEEHEGIDIGAPAGTPIRSPAAGIVMVATSGGGYGNQVTLDHGNGVRSLYGHLQRFNVRRGQRVAGGQVIGLVGSTGRSTGPHLHYEIRVNGERVNPRSFRWQAQPSVRASLAVKSSG